VIDKMKFGQVPSGVRVGDTIVWLNRDLFRHTATASDRSFEIDLPPAKSGRMILRRPGSFAFFCRFHPGMRGQLVVGR
jgi:plastocyanin